jgi:Flp pilus assembly protein TadG
MSHTSGRATPTPRRGRGDEGTALVEFTFVAVLLLTIVFGIINFGLLLSFKQDMTRAAAEGARAGAVAFPATGAWDAANTATFEAVDGFNRTCNSGDGMTCNVNLHDCATPVAPNTASNPTSTGDCVTVELVYDYDHHPLLAKLPLIEALLPDTLRDSSVARLNS